MGAPAAPGSVMAAWRRAEVFGAPPRPLEEVVVAAAAALGRFKKPRQAGELRHLGSSVSLMARR